MGNKAAPSSFGRLALTLLPEGHCCPFSSRAGACPGTGLPWGPLVACCPRETPRACEMSSGSRANQWVACQRQGRGQGGLSSTPGPRTVSLGRWGPRDGLQGCMPRGGPTLGSSAAVPSLDHPCGQLDDSGPAGRSGCAAAGPASPPSPLLSQHSRWRPGRLLPAPLAGWLPPPSQALPQSRVESSSVGDPSWPSSTPTSVCLRERLSTWRAGAHISHLLLASRVPCPLASPGVLNSDEGTEACDLTAGAEWLSVHLNLGLQVRVLKCTPGPTVWARRGPPTLTGPGLGRPHPVLSQAGA